VPLRVDPFLARFEPLRAIRSSKPWVGYAAAVLGVVAAIAARFAIPIDVAPFITFFPAIILATFLGGWRAGVASLALSALAADYFFMPPRYSLALAPGDLLALIIFILVAGAMVAVIALLNEALDRLRTQADNVNFVLESEPAGVIAVDADGRIVLVNKTAEQLFGYSRQELYGQPLETLTPHEARERHVALRDGYLRKPVPRHMGGPGMDLNGRRKDGTLFPIEVGLNPMQRGALKGALSTIIDISERRSAERRQQILADEVRHRGRNLLAVVQALAVQTIPAAARKEFVEALVGLARTQDLFLDAETAPLLKIIDAELAPFHNRVSVSDCDITLLPRAAQDFGLILHELTTNSVKHGALSEAKGRIRITGSVAAGVFTFIWEELNGPPAREPERKGLGHVILNDVAHDFCERVEASYGETGFKYLIAARLEKLNSNVIELAERRSGSEG
jgi:PAS domain S-box-containing protein